MSFTTHHSIIDQLPSNNATAWERFFAHYAPLIRLCGSDCGVPESMLEDLVQNVLKSVFRCNGAYCRERGRYRDYLRTIIRARSADLLRSYYRHQKIEKQVIFDELQFDPLFDEEWHKYVRNSSLELLKKGSLPQHYQIFAMLDIHGYGVKEVAEFFKLPLPTIYSIRKRMEEKLHRIAAKFNE